MPNTNKKQRNKPRKAPQALCKTSTPQECFDFYCARKNMNERTVCLAAQINQPWCNRVLNGRTETHDIVKLVSICLVLGLSREEATDFLARFECALSPAKALHDAYLELLAICSGKVCPSNSDEYPLTPDKIIPYANSYLKGKKLPEFPIYE